MASTISGSGTAIFRLNGVTYSTRGNVTIQPLSEEVTAGRNLDGASYFTVKPVPSTVEVELQDTGALSIQMLQGIRGSDYLTVELLNGKVYGASALVFTGLPSLNVTDGTIKAAFAGDITELTA